MASALDHVPEIARAARARPPVIFLDYDGTLTPIVDRPEDARLAPQVRDALRRIAERFKVAIVSGRDLDDVRRMVGLPELVYAGSHGFDMIEPDGRRTAHKEAGRFVPELDAAERALAARIAPVAGAFVERKRYAIAVHYRLADPAEVPLVERAVDDAARDAPGLRKTGGKKIFELRPRVDWDKGRAVLHLLDRIAPGPALPLYIGDDETDEDAFRALRGRGLGVRVGRPDEPTEADYLLDSPAEVPVFLERLAEAA